MPLPTPPPKLAGSRATTSGAMATLEFRPDGAGTRLILTEQGVFLDGVDSPAERERGTRELLDNLDAALRREPARA